MHERPLYYVFALFVALLMVNLVSPVFGDGEVNVEGQIDYISVSANKTFIDVSHPPVSVNFTAIVNNYTYTPDYYQWTIKERYDRAPIVQATTPTSQNWYNCNFYIPGQYSLEVLAPNNSPPIQHSNPHFESFGFVTAYLPVTANFTNTTTTGVLPLRVNFTDNSTDSSGGGTHKWEWQVGTGVPNQTTNPAYGVYNEAKTYTINLTAWNKTYYEFDDTVDLRINGSVSRDITIISKQPILANFSTNISAVTDREAKGLVPLCLQFLDNTTGDGLDIYNWTLADYGGNTYNNTSTNPVKTYTTPGLYDVTLKVSSGNWSSTNTSYKSHYVNAYYPIAANFTSSPADTSCIPPVFPIKYNFQVNATQPYNSAPDVCNWSFGDNTPNVTTLNREPANHTYNLPGTYDVILTTTNLTHSINTSLMKQITVTGLLANFTADPMVGYLNRTSKSVKVNFTANSTDVYGATTYVWDFGKKDGSGSLSINSNTTYNKAGLYNVTYTVGNQCRQTNSTTKTVTIIQQPVANFSYYPSYGTFPLSVQFNDTSLDEPDYWEWNFGDGSDPVLERNPIHVYASPGTYPVQLRVVNSTVIPVGTDEIRRNIILSSGINANFTANRTIGASPLTVQFKDTSLPPGLVSDREWDFDDNTEKSNLTNPVHTFIGTGNYTVNLTVWNETTKARGNHEKVIQVLDPLIANFKPNDTVRMNKTEGVQFTDLSTGNISIWFWDFGDGSLPSYDKNPVHIFPDYGDYPVNLTIENQYGDIDWIEFLVNVTPADWPYIDFEVRPPVANKMDIVQFVVTEIGGTDVSTPEWDFGDGSEKVQKNNPTHQYQKSGKFNVTAMVSNDYASARKTHVASIRGLTPDFTIVPPGGWAVVNTPITFIDNSEGNPVRWRWDFGDNEIQGTNNSVIVHSYTKEGTYFVNMTAWNWEVPPSEATAGPKKIVILNKTVPQGVDFEVPELQYSGKAPFVVQFEDKTPAQSGVVEWFWEFGDGTNSFEQAPSHRYEKPGQYTVTLTVRNENGTNEKRRVAYVVVL
jgi:PKD repeat protein